MRTLRFLLEKEFRQIFRDPAIIRLMLIMPVVQLVLLPLAANFEVKNIRLVLVDHDKTSVTHQMVNTITASGYILLTANTTSYKQALQMFDNDEADIILEIPPGFEKTLIRENKAGVLLAVNAVNGTRANLGAAYLQTIIRQYNQEIRLRLLGTAMHEPSVNLTYTNWYNPAMNYQQFMVPGILVILVTMVGAFLTALNIVKEKEIGTIEQINVTPVKKQYFILGKLIPFWVMGQVVLTIGLLIGRIFYKVIPAGNPLLIYLFSSVFLLAILGLGLLISTFAHTQQQAMLIAFFIMIIFILLGGLYTPVESMPDWAQWVSKVNPVTYFIDVMRRVIMKGSTLQDLQRQFVIITLFAIFLNTWAIINYSKRN